MRSSASCGFPAILTINNVEPADFQEAIRAEFPQYARRQDAAPPRITGLGGPSPKVEQQPPVTNHNFVSEDNQWKLNLTKDFIALSTLHYPGWEEFARQLDKPLAAFIRLYKPAYFQRVGLRYVNVFSRARLGLEGTPWAELFAPAYTAPMRERGAAGGPLPQLRLRSDGEAGLQLPGQDPRRPRRGEAAGPQCAPGPGGEVHPGHGPVHDGQHPLHPGRRGAGDAPRPLHPDL